MKEDLKITIHKHRGKPSLRWFVNGKAHYRVIRDLAHVQAEEVQLRVELQTGASRKAIKRQQADAERRQKTLADHIEDFYQDDLTKATPKNAWTAKRDIINSCVRGRLKKAAYFGKK
jgi:hypothetical protein